jgi:Lrp/AsnC family transcriptional regulator for asnA, asnC and gidA
LRLETLFKRVATVYNQAKIDETDAKILKILLKDSRTSFTEIAKNCKISVGAVRMRYKRLKSAGIIKGEIMQVSPHSLGYKYVVNLGIITTIEYEKEVAEFLKSRTYRTNIVGPFGKYNVFAVAVLHNIQELTGIVEDIESHTHVKSVESMIWAEAVNMEHMENLFFNPLDKNVEKQNTKNHNKINLEEAHIDQIDREIAKTLSQNARTPFSHIAKQLGISTKNVIQRYKRLRGTVLTHSTITVDLKKLGFKAFAFLFIKVTNRSKMPQIYAQLLQIPNLAVTVRLIGPYDLNVDIFLTNFEELFDATEQIRRIPGIGLTEVWMTPVWNEWPPNLFVSLL